MRDQARKAALPRNIARAVVVKRDDIFFLSEQGGEVPPRNLDGFGLYYHDCRYLNGYEVELFGTRPNPLFASAGRGWTAEFQLTNEKLEIPGGGTIDEQTFGLSLRRVVDGEHLAVHDVWTIENYDVERHGLALTFRIDAGFEDIFEIRGLEPREVGRERAPEWHDGVLLLTYDGADGMLRRLEAHFEPRPGRETECCAVYDLDVGPGERREIRLSFRIVEARERRAPERVPTGADHAASRNDHHAQTWLASHAEIHSDDRRLDLVVHRSLIDLGMLSSSLDDCDYFSAGLPWYGTLFGRDSITAALQTLPFEPEIAAQTLRLLARYQGARHDDWRDEEPGKILHELRLGELARLREIPQTPYYGSVDATPLFLVLLGEHAQWTGSLALFEELKPNVERALQWIDDEGTDPKTGYVCYESRSEKGLGNQGWKDSGLAITNADGSLAEPPISLVEVQGYVFRGKRLIADLYERSGEPSRARRLRAEAEELRARFERDFWMPDRGTYAIALQKGGRRAEIVSSNPGQALWSGIVDRQRAPAVVRQLMAPEMFGGWGIRTLSREERRYNPVGYHLGTVWPHDNSLIAVGFRRYGFDDEAVRVFDALVDAAGTFEHHRLPEVFGGFDRGEFPLPVRYPVACHPQAWAAGSMPYMLTSLLGLVPDAFEGRLRVLRAVLPHGVGELEFRRIRIGSGTVDLRFRRTPRGVSVEAHHRTKEIRVDVEPHAGREVVWTRGGSR